jgi:predicted RNA-binding protein associated with RNAse of E/G family
VRQIFRDADQDGNGLLDRDELYEAATKNQMLRNLLEDSINNVQKVDKIIENDLEEPFHTWIPVSANL